MNIKQKTIQGIFWSGIQNWGSQAGSFIVFLILARLLTPDAFGLVALANVFIHFMQIFLDQGFAQALIQRQNIEEQHINTAFWTQFFISIILTIIGLIGAIPIASGFSKPQLIPIFQSLSFIFIINALSNTQTTLLRRSLAFKTIAIRALLGVFIAGIVGVTMAVLGYGVWSLVGQQLTYETVGVIFLWRASDWKPKIQFSLQYLSEIYSFSLNLLGYRIVNFFNQRTDNLLVGYFFGEVALGYYAIAYRILEVMIQLLIHTMNQVALPIFSRLQDDYQRFLDSFYRANQFTSLMTFPIFLGLVILAPELVITLFGQKWINAVAIMQIMTFTGIISSFFSFQYSAFVAMGKPLLKFKLGLLNATLNIIACLIAVRWGILAVATAFVISDYLVFPIGQWFLSRLIKLSWKTYLAQFLAPITCTVIMVLIILGTQQMLTPYLNPPFRLVVCSIVGTISYGVALRVIFPQLFSQVFALVSLLRDSKK